MGPRSGELTTVGVDRVSPKELKRSVAVVVVGAFTLTKATPSRVGATGVPTQRQGGVVKGALLGGGDAENAAVVLVSLTTACGQVRALAPVTGGQGTAVCCDYEPLRLCGCGSSLAAVGRLARHGPAPSRGPSVGVAGVITGAVEGHV